MVKSILRRLPGPLASCAFTLASASCSTDEVQLESMYVALTLDDPEFAHSREDGASCLFVDNLVDEGASYEVRLNGRPLRLGEDQVLTVDESGDAAFCVVSGNFNLSLVARGKTVAQTGLISMHAGAQYVFFIRGDRRAPSIAAEEIDMSSPGPGLRRVRVTNHVTDRQPIEIYFYDQQDELRASTGIIAYGDTFEGSIPAAVSQWRYAPDDELALGLFNTPGSYAGDESCLEERPAGLVIKALPVTRGATTTFRFAAESYRQRLPSCTIDPLVCPPDSCTEAGW